MLQISRSALSTTNQSEVKMGYSAAKVSTHIELEKNRGTGGQKGLIVIVVNCHYRAVKENRTHARSLAFL